jgi:hypothetical protein
MEIYFGECRYYESIGVLDKASTMLYKCGEYEQALGLLLQLGTHEAMEIVCFVTCFFRKTWITSTLRSLPFHQNYDLAK